jgi:hypothetical protein
VQKFPDPKPPGLDLEINTVEVEGGANEEKNPQVSARALAVEILGGIRLAEWK